MLSNRKAVALMLLVSGLFFAQNSFSQCTAPAAPTVTGGTRTGAGSVTLTASGSSGAYNWYDKLNAMTKIATGTSFTTPSINMTTTFYVSAYSGTCESNRIAVTATVTYPQAWQANTNGKDVFYGQGKVGIGVMAPTEPLEVRGSIKTISSGGGSKSIILSNDESFSYIDNYDGMNSSALAINFKSKNPITTMGSLTSWGEFVAVKNTFLSHPIGFSKTFIGISQSEDLSQTDILTVRGYVRFGTSISNYIRLGHDGTNSFINSFGTGSLLLNNTFKIFANGFGDFASSSNFRPHFALNKDFNIYEGAPGSGILRLGISTGGNTFLAPNGGAVGIGTTNLSSMEGCKLAVNGTIRAKEIKVNTNWYDFVFDNDYQLMPLKQVEVYIKAHKHLPEIPSAKEVEENGVSLGEMQGRLLQKIEELTLHMIEMEKENEKMKAKIEVLESVK